MVFFGLLLFTFLIVCVCVCEMVLILIIYHKNEWKMGNFMAIEGVWEFPY